MKYFVSCVTGFGLGLLFIAALILGFLSGCAGPRTQPERVKVHGICFHPGVFGGQGFNLDPSAYFQDGVLYYPTEVGPVSLTGAACIYQRN